jgi:hypothetical protein
MTSILKVDELQDSGGNNLVTSNGSGVITASAFGKVLQVVNFVYNGASVSSTSTSFVDTDLETSITPSSTSNKILISVTFQGQTDANGIFTLSKGDTNLVGTYGFTRLEVANKQTGFSFSYLDSPSTTSATTYKLRMKNNGSGTVYFHPGGTTSTATMQLLEIQG